MVETVIAVPEVTPQRREELWQRAERLRVGFTTMRGTLAQRQAFRAQRRQLREPECT
jgi:hypothetical protein